MLRGFILPSIGADSISIDLTRDNIRETLDNAASAYYNVVFIPLERKYISFYPSGTISTGFHGYNTSDFDPVKRAIEAAHRQGLRIYVAVDIVSLVSEMDLSFQDLKTVLKRNVRNFIENYDIDGLSFDFTKSEHIVFLEGNLSGNTTDDLAELLHAGNMEQADARLIDLLEDIIVETMLVKPYLVNSLIFPNNYTHKIPYTCLNEGIVDFIVREIEINNNDLIDELEAFRRVNSEYDTPVDRVFPLFSIYEDNINGEVLNELAAIIEENGSRGILFASDQQQNIPADPLYMPDPFSAKINMPEDLKKVTPFQIVGLNIDALLSEDGNNPVVHLFQRTKTKVVDSDGNFGFIAVHPDTIDIETDERLVTILTNRWSVPFRYTLNPDGSTYRKPPWVEFRRMPAKSTADAEYHLLCKTDYPAKAWINGDSVKVYKTGIFFKKVALNEGLNRIRANILTTDSLTAFYEREFIYKKTDKWRSAFPLWIDEESIEPGNDLELLPEDIVQVSFQGSLDQEAYVEIYPGGMLIKCERRNFDDYSEYRAEIPLRNLVIGEPYQMILRMIAPVATIEKTVYEFPLQNLITVKTLDEFPLVKIIEDNSRLTYNMGPVRLGGPIRAELDPGIIVKVNGIIGENLRIRLNDIEQGMIGRENVEILPLESVQPTYFITSISCFPGDSADIISIPYLEPVPYEVYPDPDQNRIIITLFGAKTSSTWITHRKGRMVVDKITWQQTTPDTYQVYVNLKTSRIWGYDLRPDGNRLLLTVKHQPTYDLEDDIPLNGLKIAIEAGHGGESTGAVGLSGLLEKDINLDLSNKLGEICGSMGAEVYLVRTSDTTMSLIDKRSKAVASDADILISIHANAAGTGIGYLGVPGTSTYYNNPFWAPLAENIYDRLLELGLEEFGVVGSFNYTVTRVSQMPSILVEQAFMTHAEDEEKLADPEFRKKMAGKIYEGIFDYLSYMTNDR
jgi:N-acetylmuramoyl-L-alanine amidase